MGLTQEDVKYRRKYPRRKFRREIGILHRGIYRVARAEEIGEGGAAFSSNFEMNVGDCVVVNFKTPTGPFLSIQAEIRNKMPQPSGEFVYGCSFSNLKFEGKRDIRSYVTARSSLEN